MHHRKGIYLGVWNCKYALVQDRNMEDGSVKVERLPFSIPEHWAEWTFEASGGAVNISGPYRLPSMIAEWCMTKEQGDEKAATSLARKIDRYLEKKGKLPR